jgi:hypothetical protein
MARKTKNKERVMPTLSPLTDDERREAYDVVASQAGDETTISVDSFGNRTAFLRTELGDDRPVVIGLEIAPDWDDFTILN